MKYVAIFGFVTFNFLVVNIAFGQLLPKPADAFRIAILGCHRQFEPAPALARYLEVDPDLCLWIGDNVYADAPEDPAFIDTCYQALAAKPAFKLLIDEYDYMVTWDDHDFGLNDAGKEYPFKEDSKALFRNFWSLEKEIPATQAGIYYARKFEVQGKTIQIIMLDGRYNRDLPDGTGDVLGEIQWKWLEDQLADPADLRILVSGFQVLLDKDAGSETWDNFPKAQERLFETIRKQQAEHVVFLTGDQHYGEVCRLPSAMDFDAVELQFAGINQIEDPEFNPLRVSPVIKSKHSVAVLDIQMETNKFDVPHLLFRIADAMTNQVELTYRVNFDEIGIQLGFTEQTFFATQHQVTLDHRYPDLEVRYTLDGSEPTEKAVLYDGRPIELEQTTTIKARFFTKSGIPRSPSFVRTYEKLQSKPAANITGQLKPGVTYQYIEGNYTDMPDFEKESPVKKGVTQSFDPDQIAQREDHYAILFEGVLEISEEDVYNFYTISDDGSRLWVDGDLIVDNSGSHSKRKRMGLAALKTGRHTIRVEYFEDYSGQTLQVGYVNSAGIQKNLSADQMWHQP